ncbi:MAG: DUF4982 domain-containing protein [Acidobacteria bacterium]|nr:DUF4982 domain-containing protein [Acidobacteriota bacterium]
MILWLFLIVSMPLAVAAGTTTSFDAGWRFLRGTAENADKPEFDDSKWRRVDLPHDWSIEGPFDAKNPTGGAGGYLPSGVAWYRKHFRLTKFGNMNRVYVEFDGVMGISDVWINGVHLGQRPSGYVSFVDDLTEHINWSGDNVIAVRADTSAQPASRWYTGAGIYRHVRIKQTRDVHFRTWGTFVSTPQVSEKEATVKISAEVVNDSRKTRSVTFGAIIPNTAEPVPGTTNPVSLGPGETKTVEYTVTIRKPVLWDVAKGDMYEARVFLLEGKTPLDIESVRFGVREFHFDADTGFWLNGKNFKVKGVCLHADGSAFGAAVPLSVWERRLRELRKLGANAIRTAHNPPAPEFLDLADRMGFLVMDELFDQWTVAKNPYDYHLYFREWSRRDVTDTVRRDRNHPSIILWSAGNEIHDTPQPEIAIPILKGLVETFHAADPTRPVTQGLFRPNVSKDYDNGLADLLDVIGQNYREKEILAAHKQKPTRKIIGTENTHELNQWLAVRDNPEYAGHFVWSGIDYLGESAGWPTVAYNSGLLYKTGTWRPLAYQRQSWWTTAPMVYAARRISKTPKLPTDPGYNPTEERRPTVLFSDWTPANLDKHEENVEVYSNCDEVELFLNGKSLGRKPKPADDAPRNWKVDFEPGTLRAVGYNAGREAANYELKTAGKPSKLLVTVDRNALAEDWDDVATVTVAVTDDNGTLVPNAADLVTFKTEGAGALAAVDSFDNNSHEPYQATARRAFGGMCFAYLKANAKKGRIKLTATAPGLKAGSATIEVAPKKDEAAAPNIIVDLPVRAGRVRAKRA